MKNLKLPKVNQDEKDDPNSPHNIFKIKFIKNKFMKNKSPDSDGLTGKFYQTLKEDLARILHKLFFFFFFSENRRGNTFQVILSVHYYLDNNQTDIVHRRNYRSIFLMNLVF